MHSEAMIKRRECIAGHSLRYVVRVRSNITKVTVNIAVKFGEQDRLNKHFKVKIRVTLKKSVNHTDK